MDDIDLRLMVIIPLAIVSMFMMIIARFGSTISLVLRTEINIFFTGVHISIFEFVLLTLVFVACLFTYAILIRGIRWSHIVFRYNHPLTSATGFIYYLPFVESPSEKLLKELESEK